MTATFRKYEPLDPLRPLPAGLRWYVLTTAPRREFQVSQWLEANGWASLVPIEYRSKAISRHIERAAKRRVIVVPWIPRCVFVGLNGEVPWLAIMDNYHVTGVLGVGGEPIPTRPGEIDRLQEASAALLRPFPLTPVQAGQKARIAAPGLWLGHVVDVESLSGKWATTIQDWFGVRRRVRMALSDLEPV